jgi:hypothetical protein
MAAASHNDDNDKDLGKRLLAQEAATEPQDPGQPLTQIGQKLGAALTSEERMELDLRAAAATIQHLEARNAQLFAQFQTAMLQVTQLQQDNSSLAQQLSVAKVYHGEKLSLHMPAVEQQ